MREGQGTMTHPEYGTYTGNFHLDRQNGFGRYEWPDGNVYEGEFLDDKLHGNGVFMYADGDRFEGQYANGLREVRGPMSGRTAMSMLAPGQTTRKPETAPRPIPMGAPLSAPSRTAAAMAFGTYTAPDGTVQTGMFSAGTYIGRAGTGAQAPSGAIQTINYDDGAKYVGEVSNGQPQGKGRFEWKDGASMTATG